MARIFKLNGDIFEVVISISLLFHVRGNGSFLGLNFHIQDVEIEPPVLKEIPPLSRVRGILVKLPASSTSPLPLPSPRGVYCMELV